jgi:hypothetical protein
MGWCSLVFQYLVTVNAKQNKLIRFNTAYLASIVLDLGVQVVISEILVPDVLDVPNNLIRGSAYCPAAKSLTSFMPLFSSFASILNLTRSRSMTVPGLGSTNLPVGAAVSSLARGMIPKIWTRRMIEKQIRIILK